MMNLCDSMGGGVEMNMKKGVLFLILMLAVIFMPGHLQAATGCDGAGNCYIYAAASGTGSGASWANAYTGFNTGAHPISAGSLSRGVTYWIAAGSYGAQTFSSPDSGTTVITIEAATNSSHGPASDWSNSYQGQALFIGGISISTDYWVFNGQTRGSDWQSGYNLKFWYQTGQCPGNNCGPVMLNGNHVTLEYVEGEGTGQGFPTNTSTADKCSSNNCGNYGDVGIYTGSSAVTNLYVGYGYWHHTGNTQFQMNGAVSNYLTWEYNWVSYNHTGQNGMHDEAFSLVANNVAIRYNVFQDICSTGIITDASAGTPTMSNWYIYGNIFFWDDAYANYAVSGRARIPDRFYRQRDCGF